MRARGLAAPLDGGRVLLAIGLLGAAWGMAVAAGGLISLYLCASLIACGFILFDFRIGVVLLILLMPMSGSSTLFPHEMFGVVGLNPLNVLLAGTLISCMLHALADNSLRRLLPRPLLWLYIVPILIAGAIGSRHIREIAPTLLIVYQGLDFPDAASYLRDMVLKPMLMLVFAVVVGAAVAKSARPERFLLPALVSICMMALLVLVYVAHSGVALAQLAKEDSRQFLSTLGLHANDLGRLYAVGYALVLFTWSDAPSRALRLALLAAAAMTAVALILTFSRGAFVALAVVSALYVLWRFSAKTLLVAACAAVAALLFARGAISERLSSGEGAGLNAISSGRLNGLWLPLLPEVWRHAVLGNGIGSILWSDAMRRGAGQTMLVVTHPHNAYLQAALDMGITGLLLLCAYFAHVWRGLRALAKDPAVAPALRGFYQGAAAGLAGIMVANCTDSSLTPRPEQAFLWLAIGMMYGYQARRAAATTVAHPACDGAHA
ncbi:MAG: O-antigen ligase family protein [Gammaproteobacteria bacterium]|nr:MAG: O-antigen ligase family protein [Gammaproteobacteria bacterium]